ncbi:unannotated protein [freshwater metagenome]|uniref:Unannotated protein n=1 Tax=freshwater metagenome TaxID=449393 RepID=A0A6J7FBC8_9ZZZZ
MRPRRRPVLGLVFPADVQPHMSGDHGSGSVGDGGIRCLDPACGVVHRRNRPVERLVRQRSPADPVRRPGQRRLPCVHNPVRPQLERAHQRPDQQRIGRQRLQGLVRPVPGVLLLELLGVDVCSADADGDVRHADIQGALGVHHRNRHRHLKHWWRQLWRHLSGCLRAGLDGGADRNTGQWSELHGLVGGLQRHLHLHGSHGR